MADETRGSTPADPRAQGAYPTDGGGRHEAPPAQQSYGSTAAGAPPVAATPPTTTPPTTVPPTTADRHDRDGDGVDDRRQPHPAPVAPVDRDGDGRDDRTGAVIPTTAKEMAAAQRARFGGLHMGSAFFGWLSAVGISVILLAILSAAGLAFGLYNTLGTTQDAADEAATGIGLGAAIALLVVLFVAYLAGGYVAGRMARFNGTKQGLGVWLWGIIVTVLAALAGLVLGTQYNVFDQLNLPALPVESGTATTAGLIALGAVLVVTLLGAVIGGKLGSRYHRRVDRAAFEPAPVA